uniref:Uncharacterized protein n=1 Tax=uncultured Caudovirales phage TaxID=2100421 RepID=A0A6J5L2K9_9CAUD|nr:hypothetical protein UFOVP114_78 [uncultured Caudovirales phage]
MAYLVDEKADGDHLQWPQHPEWKAHVPKTGTARCTGADGSVHVQLDSGTCGTSFRDKPRQLPPLEVLTDFLGACAERSL